MTNELRAALIEALAEIEQIQNPSTEPGGWWDKRIEPLYQAIVVTQNGPDDPNDGDDPRLWTDEYAADYAQAVAADRGQIWNEQQVKDFVAKIRTPGG